MCILDFYIVQRITANLYYLVKLYQWFDSFREFLKLIVMGRKRQTKKFATMKRMISASDPRLKDKDRAAPKKKKAEDPNEIKTTEHVQQSSALFFQYNTQLGPPFHILVDTNFINFSIKNKMDIIQSMMDCLYAKCIPYITDCVMAELEKLGSKFRIALRIVKDPRFERLPCMHKVERTSMFDKRW